MIAQLKKRQVASETIKTLKAQLRAPTTYSKGDEESKRRRAHARQVAARPRAAPDIDEDRR
jgi:hypothetical protein